MFSKILVANRGGIAVRILRTCREMGIASVALYQPSDRTSLHVWMADESIQLESPLGFFDQEEILRIAVDRCVDAIHPGYGYLAEREDFARRCESRGITYISPPSDVLNMLQDKVGVLKRAQEAGFPVPEHSINAYRPSELAALRSEAQRLGYPLVIKSSRGGRGRGARLVWTPERLERALRRAHAEALIFYGERRVYLEKAVLPAHQIGVQVVGDRHGQLVHLGEREGSILYGNQKIIEESPAPCLTDGQRAQLLSTAFELAHLFNIQNVVTLEFLVDQNGEFCFTEFKPRIQIEHSLTEVRSRFDLVRAQITTAAGLPLEINQEDIHLSGWAIHCRISASDPWRKNFPSPGHVSIVRFPTGPDVRVDSYLYSGADVPAEYDPLIANVIAFGNDRPTSIRRLRNALLEFQVIGTETNLPLIQRIVEQSEFINGEYSTDLLISSLIDDPEYERRVRDLAVVAAVMQNLRKPLPDMVQPPRLSSGWHRQSRRLS